MITTQTFCLGAAGSFFLCGLVTGAWKYLCIASSPDARAPVYVDIAHRASLLYAFACALLATFAARSAFTERTNLVAAHVLVVFFAVSVLGYIVHGALRDTDNQLARPHRLHRAEVPAWAMRSFMVALIVGEIGSFLVIFAGWLSA